MEVLTRTEAWFRSREVPSPRLDAELLLCHVLAMKRLDLYLAYDRPMQDGELDALRPLVRRRGQREPLAWITGTVGFHTLELAVHPGVLVPRPDTETLVDAALSWIGTPPDRVFVADVGCGTGAVGLALAAALPTVCIYAIDLDETARANTRDNIDRLGLGDRVALLSGSMLDPIPSRRAVDWVVSNPPYIATDVLAQLEPEVSKHEPRLALDGGPDGLAAYRELIPSALKRARAGVLVEVGAGQAEDVATLFREAGAATVHTWPDLSGINRVVGGRHG